MNEIPIIFHNPRCGKSRAAKAALQQVCEDAIVVEYLDGKLNAKTLKEIVRMTGKKPLELIRKNEKVFLEKYFGKELSDEKWIEAIVKDPILLQRPIVVYGDKAMITRDEESLNTVIKSL